MQRLLILGLGVEGTSTDRAGELTTRSGTIGRLFALGEDLSDVGVGGVVHVAIIQTGRGVGGGRWTVRRLSQTSKSKQLVD